MYFVLQSRLLHPQKQAEELLSIDPYGSEQQLSNHVGCGVRRQTHETRNAGCFPHKGWSVLNVKMLRRFERSTVCLRLEGRNDFDYHTGRLRLRRRIVLKVLFISRCSELVELRAAGKVQAVILRSARVLTSA